MTAASFTFQSSDGTDIYSIKWSPEDRQKPRAAVQIAHGYAEHIGRYETFAFRIAKANQNNNIKLLVVKSSVANWA